MDCLDNAFIVVPQQQGPVPTVEIYIFVAIDIPFVRTLCSIHINGIGLKVPGVMYDTARQHLVRA
jgi:hypothetical protein